MSSGPRSTVLAKFSFSGAVSTAVVICPVGQTIIVKSITIANQIAAATLVANVVLGGAGGTVNMYLIHESLEQSSTTTFDTWTVLSGNDALFYQTSSGPSALWISGTLLQGESSYVQPAVPSQLPFPQGFPTA